MSLRDTLDALRAFAPAWGLESVRVEVGKAIAVSSNFGSGKTATFTSVLATLNRTKYELRTKLEFVEQELELPSVDLGTIAESDVAYRWRQAAERSELQECQEQFARIFGWEFFCASATPVDAMAPDRQVVALETRRDLRRWLRRISELIHSLLRRGLVDARLQSEPVVAHASWFILHGFHPPDLQVSAEPLPERPILV